MCIYYAYLPLDQIEYYNYSAKRVNNKSIAMFKYYTLALYYAYWVVNNKLHLCFSSFIFSFFNLKYFNKYCKGKVKCNKKTFVKINVKIQNNKIFGKKLI